MSFSKPSYQPAPRQPFRPSYVPGYKLPTEVIDDKKIQELFQIVDSADFDKMKNFVSENNIIYNVRNYNGETVLHSILELDNSKEDKLNMIKFFVSHGVAISAFDKFNVTALHIAAKKQYADIVLFLLQNGATPNAEDSSKMLPIHYAVQGNIKKCKDKKKVGDIVPGPIEERKEVNKTLLEATKVILQILFNPDFNQYITHITNAILNYRGYFEQEINELKTQLDTQILEIQKRQKTQEEQKKDMIDARRKIKDQLEGKIKGKLTILTNEMTIQPNQADGWGVAGASAQETGLFKVLPAPTNDKFVIEQRKQIDTTFDRVKTEIIAEINKMITMTIELLVIYSTGDAPDGPIFRIRYQKLADLVDDSDIKDTGQPLSEFEDLLARLLIDARGITKIDNNIINIMPKLQKALIYISAIYKPVEKLKNNIPEMIAVVKQAETLGVVFPPPEKADVQHLIDDFKNNIIDMPAMYKTFVEICTKYNTILNLINRFRAIDMSQLYKFRFKNTSIRIDGQYISPFPLLNLKLLPATMPDVVINEVAVDDYVNFIKAPFDATRRMLAEFKIQPDTNTDKSKSEAPNEIMGGYFDEHLYSIKYFVLMNILEKVHGDYAPVRPDNASILNDIVDSLDTIKEDHRVAYAMAYIGSLTDSILRNYISYVIKNSANITSNENFKSGFEDTNTRSAGILKDTLRLDEVKAHILKPETEFKFNLNEIIEEIVEKFYHKLPGNQRSMDILAYTSVLAEPEKDPQKQYQLYSVSYNEDTIYEKKCYDMDDKTLQYLLEHNSKVSPKDGSGNTPLHYSIDMMYPNSVQLLLSKFAMFHNKASRNYAGLSPYRMAIDNYKKHNEFLYNEKPENMLRSLYKGTYKKIEKSLQDGYKNNVIKFLNIAFPQVLIMYNNVIYSYAKHYVRKWTYDNHKQLMTFLVDYDIVPNTEPHQKVPILDLNSTEITEVMKASDDLHVAEHRLSQFDNDMKKKKDKYDEYDSIRKSLLKEKQDIESRGITNKAYHDSLKDKIAGIMQILQDLSQEMTDIKPTQNSLQNNTQKSLKERIYDFTPRVKTFSQSSERFTDNYVQLYESIFKDVISPLVGTKYDNFFSYDKLWEVYLGSQKLVNIENIHLTLMAFQNKLIPVLINADKNTVPVAEFNLLSSFYTSIVSPLIDDYKTLPQYLRENYALNEIKNIIVHVIGHVVGANMYYAIIKIITKYVRDRNAYVAGVYKKQKNYREYINQIMIDILNVKDPATDQTLESYLTVYLPEKLTKKMLEFYDDEEDPDRRLDMDGLFTSIITLLKENKTLVLADDSDLIKNIKTYLFPYYKDIYTQMIQAMKVLIDNYNRYLMNEKRHIEIISLLLNHVK